MKMLAIVNPRAGGATRIWPRVRKALEGRIIIEEKQTQGKGHATTLAATASSQHAGVIVVGGDGTLFEVVNGLRTHSRSIPIGLVPNGTGNDFAKLIPPTPSVGQDPYDWQEAVHKIMGQKTELFNVGQVTLKGLEGNSNPVSHCFVNSFTVGFGALGASIFTRFIRKFVGGKIGYQLAALATFLAYRTPRIRLQIGDTKPYVTASTMVALMLGRCYGGSFWFAPETTYQDPCFRAFIADRLSRRQVLSLLPKIKNGTHQRASGIHTLKTHRVVIEAAPGDGPLLADVDGEVLPRARNLTIEIQPHCLPVFI